MCGSAGGPFPDKPIYETRTSDAIRNTKNGTYSALVLTPTAAASAAQESGKDASVSADKRLVGLKACSTGIEPAPASQSFSASTRSLKKAIYQIIKSIKHQQIQ
jgi:hypothetical protein